jgi:hypothetical protein
MSRLFEGAVESPVYAQQLLTHLLHDTIRIHAPITLETSHALGVYQIREQIQREVTRKEVALGYEVLLTNLAKEADKEVAVCWVSTVESGYLVFANVGLSRVIGILKLPYSKNDKKLEDEVFIKGKRVKE